MMDSAVLIVKVSNKKTGLQSTDLQTLFYGDGSPDPYGSDKHALISWEVLEADSEMDSFSFVLSNPTLKLFDSPLLAKGNMLNIQFGEPGKLSTPKDFIITKRVGWRELTISGEAAEETLLGSGVANEKFENVSIADVAKTIFARDGLKAVIVTADPRSTKNHKTIQRTNETPYKFLRRMTKKLGLAYEVYVENGTGYFQPKKFSDEPAMILHYGTETEDAHYNLYDEPSYSDDQMNTATEETVRGQDLMNKTALEGKANNETSKQTALGKKSFMFDKSIGKFREAEPNKTKDTGRSVPTGVQSLEDTKGLADSSFDKKNSRQNNITWPLLGDATIRAKTPYQIACGVASIDGTRWYAEKVRHACDNGEFSTVLTLITNSTGLAPGAEAALPEADANKKNASNDSGKNGEVKYKYDDGKGKFVPTNVGGKT